MPDRLTDVIEGPRAQRGGPAPPEPLRQPGMRRLQPAMRPSGLRAQDQRARRADERAIAAWLRSLTR